MRLGDRLKRRISRRDILKGVVATVGGVAASKVLPEVTKAEPIVEPVPMPAQPPPWWDTNSTVPFGGTLFFRSAAYPMEGFTPNYRPLQAKPRGKRRQNCKQCGGPLVWDFYGGHCQHCETRYVEEETT